MKIPLGIEIYSEIISDDFYNFLLTKYNGISDKRRKFQNHNFFNGGDYTFLETESETSYYQQNILYHVNQYIGKTNYRIDDQWINVQAHNDFVPLHEHYGKISYVIYLKIPGYLQELYSSYNPHNHKGLSCVEGCIDFHYGIKNSLFPASKKIMPKEKQILMFPSEILHYVYPFSNPEETRVSVSGNLTEEN